MKAYNIFLPLVLVLLLQLPSPLLAINPDIPLLLSFKSSILSDPSSVLSNWGYFDTSPCSWNGVLCTSFPLTTINITTISDSSNTWVPTVSRVIGLVLPNSQLLGPISPELGLIKHLRHLDLSGNLFNGTLPSTLFNNANELRVLSLSNNEISGEVPQSIGQLKNLQILDLAGNAITGVLPTDITLLPNLTTVSVSNNYLHGDLPDARFGSQLQTLDLSSNLFNGTVPVEFGGENIKYLNLSDNHFTGTIPPELGTAILPNATVDFSFNNFTGTIPQTGAFLAQKPDAFLGNPELCGAPLENLCTIPSTLSNPPNSTDPTTESKSPPAIAAIPNNTQGNPAGNGGQLVGKQGGNNNNRLVTIVAIAAGDLAGIALLSVVVMYVYHVRKNRQQREPSAVNVKKMDRNGGNGEVSDKPGSGIACCLRKKNRDGDETEETSESSETEAETPRAKQFHSKKEQKKNNPNPVLVTIDGSPDLELETLLKASAYILGAAGPNIVYKAVLADGTALAVRRIGDNGGKSSNGGDRLKEFETQVRAIARVRHPNVLRIRGFYWGPEEKLLIHDFAPNGSLANASFRKKQGSSPLHTNWNTRVRIARGIARGLSYIHEKKQVHGNIKPSNILLGFEFEPLIGDFGLDRLIKPDPTTNRQFGSKRSALSLPDLSPSLPMSPFAGPSTQLGSNAPYQAPETLKNLKPSAKSDVYSFGVVLLELISGRVLSDVEICQLGSASEQPDQVMRMVDAGLRGEVRGREEAVISFFKLGSSCCAVLPQKRPSMKDAMQVLDRIPYDS